MTQTTSPTTTKEPEKIPTHKSRNTAKPGGSVFDRLYGASTASSRTRKTTGPAVARDILAVESRNEKIASSQDARKVSRKNRPLRSQNTRPKQPKEAVFNRLYKSSTSSCQSKYRSGSKMKENELKKEAPASK